MDTTLLETFLAVARHRSFTAAAEELHLVQSTVTSRVQALEKQLGARLLDRHHHGATLTDVGAVVLERAQDVLDAERRMVESASASGEPVGVVRIGAPESVCAYLLPAVIAGLRESCPGVKVHLVASGTDETVRDVLHRTQDLGLVLDDRPPQPPLVAVRLLTDRVDVVAPPGSRSTMSWSEVAEQPLFLLEEGCSYSDAFLQRLDAEVGVGDSVTRFGSIEAARSCVESGLGLSVLPRLATARARSDGRVVRLARPRLPDVPLVLVQHGGRWRSPAVAAVADALRQAARGWR